MRNKIVGSAKKNSFVGLAAAVCVLMLLLWIKADTRQTADSVSKEQIEIGLTYWGGEPVRLATQAAIRRFEKDNPGIVIAVSEIEWSGYSEKILTQLSTGQTLDVIQIPYVNASEYLMKSQLLPLDPYLENGSLSSDGFCEDVMQPIGDGVHYYGIPSGINCGALFYNKEIFDRFGIPHPNENWTWDDYFQAARELTRDTDSDGEIDLWGSADLANDIGIDIGFDRMVYERGGFIWNKDQTRTAFDSKAGLDVLQLYWSMSQEGIVPPQAMVDSNTSGKDFFEQQKVAMVIHNLTRAPIYDYNCVFSYGITVMPRGNQYDAYWVQPTSLYCINKKSQNTDACVRLLEYLGNASEAYEELRYVRGVPANTCIADQLSSRLSATEKMMASVVTMTEERAGDVKREAYPPIYMEYYRIIKSEKEAMLYGEKTPSQALADAAQAVDAILKQVYRS